MINLTSRTPANRKQGKSGYLGIKKVNKYVIFYNIVLIYSITVNLADWETRFQLYFLDVGLSESVVIINVQSPFILRFNFNSIGTEGTKFRPSEKSGTSNNLVI
eukprot:NODE_289_length_10645_cov_0.615115.p10 type:complete len:104 gc:universal NODE_289_length_10645_cov_0.615115:4462-4151(-)